MTDLVITWPKTKPLQDYLDECERAAENDLVVNYRVANRPTRIDFSGPRPPRTYVVHDRAIRGWQELLGVVRREQGEVMRVESPSITDHGVTGHLYAGYWPAGVYLVRDPEWHPVEPIRKLGFQGWRYYTPTN